MFYSPIRTSSSITVTLILSLTLCLSMQLVFMRSFPSTSQFLRSEPVMVGGFTDSQNENPSEMDKKIEELRQVEFFVKSEAYARKYYSDLNNGRKRLGELISVESQVVSGINYKMLFKTENKQQNAEIIVWTKPWLDTYKILDPVVYKKAENTENSNPYADLKRVGSPYRRV